MPFLPRGKTLALSPHMIRKEDEALYGEYNAGFFWTNQPTFAANWKKACKTSRFFEQAALETSADSTREEECYFFGPEVNYGWWRMFQSSNPPTIQQATWSIQDYRTEYYTGLCVNTNLVCCIHTHWRTKDRITAEFNAWILKMLKSTYQTTKVRTLLELLLVHCNAICS
jgi:hypothetical protein